MSKIQHRAKGGDWKEEEVGDKPLVILTSQGDVDVKSEHITLDPTTTVWHGEQVKNIDPEAIPIIERILGYPMVVQEERELSDKHIIGLIDLLIKLDRVGVHQVFVKYPETYLHPKQSLELAQFVIEWSTRE
jgi:hypothetical protein